MERNQEGKTESPREGDKLPPQPKFRPFEKEAKGRTHAYLDYLHIFLDNEGDQCVSRIDSGISNQERAFIAG